MRTTTMSWKILFEVSTGYRSSPPSARKRSAAPTRSLVRRVNHAHRSPRSSTRNEPPIMVYPVVHGDLDPHWALAEGRAVGAPPKHRSPGHSVLSATAPRFELARQPFVLLRHIEQTCAGFWNHFFVGPLADLTPLF